MMDLLRTYAETLQAIANLVAILAIIPAATIFFINQKNQQRDRRESKYIEANNKYQSFLELAINYPRLRVTQSSTPAPNDLTPE